MPKVLTLGRFIESYQIGENLYVACHRGGVCLFSFKDNGVDIGDEIRLTTAELGELDNRLRQHYPRNER